MCCIYGIIASTKMRDVGQLFIGLGPGRVIYITCPSQQKHFAGQLSALKEEALDLPVQFSYADPCCAP